MNHNCTGADCTVVGCDSAAAAHGLRTGRIGFATDGQRRAPVKFDKSVTPADMDTVGRFIRSSMGAELDVGSATHVAHGQWLKRNPDIAGHLIGRAVSDVTEGKLPDALRQSVLHDITTFTTGTITWTNLGFPVFNLTLDFFRSILVTDFGDLGDEVMRLPFPAFVVRCPEPLHGTTRNLFVYPVDHRSVDFTQLKPGDPLVFRMTLQVSPDAPAKDQGRQAYTQWPADITYDKFLRGKATPIEHVNEVEATASKELGTTIDPNATAIARRVLGNLLLYINANGGLPAEKRLGPTVSVEREHNTEPRFRVGRPVKLGPQLRAALAYSGDRGAPKWKLAQRFVVRGHYKRQAHGPGRALRKTIWVQPFWKGPTDLNEAFTRTFDVE